MKNSITLLVLSCGLLLGGCEGLESGGGSYSGSSGRFRCTLCEQSFDTRREVQVHGTAAHGNLPVLNCVICGRSGFTNRSLRRHFDNDHTQDEVRRALDRLKRP